MLMVKISTVGEKGISFIDALFTATSAAYVHIIVKGGFSYFEATGISINGVRVADEGASIDAGQLHLGRYLFVRVGRKKFYVLSVVR